MLNVFTEISYNRWLALELSRLAESMNILLLIVAGLFERCHEADFVWNK